MKIMTIMKKIFFALVTIFALAACVQEDLPLVDSPDNSAVCEGEVVIEGSISVPAMQEATRAFGSEAISRLHILVYDENGYLVQAEDAVLLVYDEENDKLVQTEVHSTSSGTEYKFEVALAQSGYKRTVHLIANSPYATKAGYKLGEHMRRVTDALSTTGKQEAFFGEVILTEGIKAKVDENGTPILKDNKQQPNDYVVKNLTKVPMLRNYTRVTLTNNASSYLANAEIMMVNIPNSGSVAPLISDGVYAHYATRNVDAGTYTAKNYMTLRNEGFVGYEPSGRELVNSTDKYSARTTSTVQTGDITDGFGTTIEFYERYQRKGDVTVATPAYAIVRGKYRSSTDVDFDSDYTYYKIDLCYEENNEVKLYNLLRNMQYDIIITNVADKGYDSLDQDWDNITASNNLSFSTQTQNLLNISDGFSRLSVEYTQKVLTPTNMDDGKFTLKYKYEPSIGGNSDNSKVTFSGHEGGNVIDEKVSDVAEIDSDGVATGWNIVTFKAKDYTQVTRQTIMLTAENLSRQVEYILGDPYRMTLDMVPDSTDNKVAKTAGITVDAQITIPTGLPDALFPLEIFVVAESSSLSSTLPVKTGLDSEGRPVANGSYFGYVVTYEADQYFKTDEKGNRLENDWNNVIELSFKTNMDDSSSIVNAYNPYFYVATDSFYCEGAAYGLKFQINGSEFELGTGKQIPALLNINTLNIPTIDDSAWSKDSSNNQYLDFDFTYSNSGSVKLTGATFDGITTAQQAYVVVVDNDTLRIYKHIYDAGIRAFNLTFTTLKPKSATTITVSNAKFGSASDAFTNPYLGAITWSLGTLVSDTPGALTITLPAEIPANLFPINLTISVTAKSRTDLFINNSSNLAVGESITYEVKSDAYNSSRTISIPIEAVRTDDGRTSSFTISLASDYFDNPDNISKRKERNSNNYQ